jgi:cell division septal protein FtsQ
MSLAAIAAWAMFAVLIAWLGMVLFATFRNLDSEVREARASGNGRDDGDGP